MIKRLPFTLVYADVVKTHLRAIDSKHRSLIRTEIETHLLHEPDVETRNRKPLRRPIEFGADWELRCGPDNRFRVFYEINSEEREVCVLAIGVKVRNRLLFAGEEFEE